MGEGEQAVVHQRRRALSSKRVGHVDDVDIDERLGAIGQRQIGGADAIAVTVRPTFGEAQRLNGRLGQVVDENRRGGAGAQFAEQASGFGDEFGDPAVESGAPRARGADDDGVEAALRDQFDVLGEGRDDVEIEAARAAFEPQILGLHLHVAIADERDVEARPCGAEASQGAGFLSRPILLCAFAGEIADAVQRGARVAVGERSRESGGLFGGIIFREESTIHQRGDGAGQRPWVLAESGGEPVQSVGHLARGGEGL
jgi:hypothetical protein